MSKEKTCPMCGIVTPTLATHMHYMHEDRNPLTYKQEMEVSEADAVEMVELAREWGKL